MYGFKTTPRWLIRLGLAERLYCGERWWTAQGALHVCYHDDGHRGGHTCRCRARKALGT